MRCFEDTNVIHVEGKISPIDDLETIETELVLSDLEIVEKRIEKVGKQLRNGDKALEDEYEYLEKIKKELSDKGFNADLSSNSDEDFLKNLQLIVSKSFFILQTCMRMMKKISIFLNSKNMLKKLIKSL